MKCKQNILTYNNNSYPYYEFTDLYAAETENGQELDAIPANTEFFVSCNLKQITALEGTDYGTLIFAAYDDSGALIDMGYKKIENPEDVPHYFYAFLKSDEKPVGSIKVFIWDTLDSMKPLALAKTLTFTE